MSPNQTALIQNPVQSVIGAIFSEDRTEILLIERRDVPVWVLPGGGIELGESPEQAIKREILEETGFTVKVDRFIGLYTPINRLTKTTHLYECKIVGGAPAPSAESKRIRFFPLSKLPYLIPPPFPDWIQDAYTLQPPITKSLSNVTYKQLLFYFLRHPLLVIRFLLSRIGLHVN